MKTNSIFSLLMVLLVALSVGSCNKDDDNDNSNTNKFTFDGTTYNLSKGFLEDFGDNGNGSYDFDVTLTTDGISLTGGALTGTGTLVYLDLNTSTGSGLENGTYNFSTTREPFTWVDGTIGVDYNIMNFTGTATNATGGTVEVDVNGNTVSIDFTLQTPNGTATGNYTGTLTNL